MYKLIASGTTSSSQNVITFSSIPQTYTDLVIKYTSRVTSTFTISMRINGSATTYQWTRLFGSTTGAISTAGSNTTFSSPNIDLGTQLNTTSYFAPAEIYINNYTTTSNRVIWSTTSPEQGASSTIATSLTSGGQNNNNANSITDITLTSVSNWVDGSKYWLYGIS
jgi:hypothetical protein